VKITKRQLRKIIRESWYEHGQREEDERMEPRLGSFPSRWTQGQMDAWETGFNDAVTGESPDMRPDGDPDAYADGYADGLNELETHPVGGRGMRQR